jgi:hypothetical protein
MDSTRAIEMSQPDEVAILRSTAGDLAVMAKIGKRQQLRVRPAFIPTQLKCSLTCVANLRFPPNSRAVHYSTLVLGGYRCVLEPTMAFLPSLV